QRRASIPGLSGHRYDGTLASGNAFVHSVGRDGPRTPRGGGDPHGPEPVARRDLRAPLSVGKRGEERRDEVGGAGAVESPVACAGAFPARGLGRPSTGATRVDPWGSGRAPPAHGRSGPCRARGADGTDRKGVV